MKLFCQLFVGVLLIAFSWARPRYLAIPWDYVQLMELSSRNEMEQASSIPRLRRDIPSKTTKTGNYYQPLGQASSQFEQNNAFNPNEYVDYGAHTGNSGSFGWYADFPVH